MSAKKRQLYDSRDRNGRWLVGEVVNRKTGQIRVIDRYTQKSDAQAHAKELRTNYPETWKYVRVFDSVDGDCRAVFFDGPECIGLCTESYDSPACARHGNQKNVGAP
jgi:hypothetical protein